MAANLEGRRRSLTALYNDEMASWTAEINDIGESPGERKEALRARATALRDAREKDRREFVESCYQKQWRDQCDDARTLDSKAMMKFVSSDRKVQESQKLDVKAQAAVDEAAYVDEWRVRMDELEKLELAKEVGHSHSRQFRHPTTVCCVFSLLLFVCLCVCVCVCV